MTPSILNVNSEATLIADLKATFPGLPARPIRDFKADGLDYGVWTGSGSHAAMSDGEPIFISWHCEGYDGGVHDGFTQWLQNRGWYIENYDGAVFFILPIAFAQQP